ncbi:peptide ABC transporter permease [Cupriavidus sp. TA19]|uniref:ABC transporter permease n=1 Tax=unclassified Cupriavidus TaxID=2640874 RepID=UPI000E2FC4EF|nr:MULTISPECIES: ABC transporter permease [unclassified Cupriavidus]BDB24461.1 ABC transporter permease [Cupriavidus sp. P-10]GLC91504.1 peptide ABC transporter permease [Cupriavidus sp. TA19]
MTSLTTAIETAAPAAARRPSRLRTVLGNGAVRAGGAILLLMLFLAVAAPWLYTIDPNTMDPASSQLAPGTRAEIMTLAGDTFERLFLFGTDSLGRDIWSRTLYGARVSLAVGVCVALASVVLGLAVGLVSGYFRWLDGPVMRVMDGMMAIPGILFAIVLVAAWRPSLLTVIVAMTVPDTPRVARLVRSVVLSVREEPYVEAAIALDTPAWKLMLRHILPNTIAPLLVQGTFICAGAMLVEAVMSFLGIGLPTDIPTWGNIMAEGRAHFTSHPHSVLLPGAFLALTVLAVNMLGDGLRDTLDPKFNKRNG